MKTKIILTEKPKQTGLSTEAEKQIKSAVFLALKAKGLLTPKQYEECIKNEAAE